MLDFQQILTAARQLPRPSQVKLASTLLQEPPDADAHEAAPTLQPLTGLSEDELRALSLYSSTADLGLAGVIGFYAGMRRAWDEQKGPLPDAARYAKVPVLGLFGGDDPGIPNEQVRALDEILDKAGVSHSIHIYDNAPHSFFDRRYAEWKDACDDAWSKIFQFIETHKQRS